MPTLDSLDEYVFAPMFGFRDRHEYRANMAVYHELGKIRVPCMILNARDDFLIKRDIVPFKKFFNTDNFIYAETEAGSHVCHIGYGRYGLLPTHWHFKPICEYFKFVHNRS